MDGTAGGVKFDGIGAVSGGGATSVLLKDYPETQRSQILDLLFKPKFGCSMSALYVEVPGDGNSTQGSELSHMHSRTDENYSRGYEWWLMVQAKKRNPDISLDGAAWSAPYWVGNNSFWSQDMADYYVKWIKGLKTNYGLDMDAIGCRNEWGTNESWVQTFRTTLNNAGLNSLRIHAFDEPGTTEFDWVPHMNTSSGLKNAVGIIGGHTMAATPVSSTVKQISVSMGKPIWNTEEHPYTQGFAGALETMHNFNVNYVQSGVTKVVNWYLLAALYPVEPFYSIDPPIYASSPWTGHYSLTPKFWAYAHYGQFSAIGWKYLNNACGYLSHGTYVTLTSGTDYSVIIETQGATSSQTMNFTVKGGLSTGAVCVWKSNSSQQFVQQASITPVNGSFSISLEANAIYSLSTTTGQQKGSFPNVPSDAAFPLPYYETFDHYSDAKSFGYLPHYTADISGGFEIATSPTGTGKCLRQVISQKDQSWGPEWMPYTVFGDQNWKDYEISADVYLDNGGWAGVMGHIQNTGANGWGCNPNGYSLRLDNSGNTSLWWSVSNSTTPNGAAGTQIATGKASGVGANQWHNVKLQFLGSTISGFVDNNQVFKVTNSIYNSGVAGLVTGGESNARNTAYFDNVIVNTVNGAKPSPTTFAGDANPMYGAAASVPVANVDKLLLEAENAQLAGGAAATSDAARSNGAYVNLQGGSMVWTDSLTKAGTYDIALNMSSPYGTKLNTFFVDGDSTSFTVDSSVTYAPVVVASAKTLKAGTHTFTLNAQWGWIDVDYLQLVAPSAIARTLARGATPVAVSVPGGIQMTGLDGIRQIKVMEVSGKVLAVARPKGATAHLPVNARGMVLLSFEDATGIVSSSKVVLP